MSLRAELVRLGLRWLMIPRGRSEDTVERLRRQTERFTRWAPSPPAKAETEISGFGRRAGAGCHDAGIAADRHVLFLHGGGYVTGSPELYRHITWRLADAARRGSSAIDYRLAPEHPFPAALDDAFDGLARAALAAAPTRAGAVSWAIRPAAGWLWRWRCGCATLAMPLPAAIVALSPWTDLALTGDSLAPQCHRRSDADIAEDPPCSSASYLAGADPRDPYASPLYGDPAGPAADPDPGRQRRGFARRCGADGRADARGRLRGRAGDMAAHAACLARLRHGVAGGAAARSRGSARSCGSNTDRAARIGSGIARALRAARRGPGAIRPARGDRRR